MKLNFLIFILSLALFSACVKDKPQPVPAASVNLSTAKKVYIINEGNYMYGNASVSLFDTGNNSVVENYFYAQNSTALGDVAQSITKINNEFYIVVNNSNKIMVCDESFKVKRTISGLTSPRYIQQVSNQKAYVSDLYANAISIINLSTGVKTGSIACYGKTEQMVMLYNKVYVTNTDKNYMYVINAVTDQIIDSVGVGYGAGNIAIDKNDYIWVLTSGFPNTTEDTFLSRFDPNNLHTSMTGVSFGLAKPTKMCINGTKDTLFYINTTGIGYAPVDNMFNKSENFIPKGTKNFYGIGIHPVTHDIYLSDAMDYVQKSNIYIYSGKGVQKQTFKAGVNANGFYFE